MLVQGTKIQVLKPFLTSGPTFSTKQPPNEPPEATSHIMGSHWYLYGVPGSSNMPIVVIFLDPIHQSRPKMGPICQNHNFMCRIDIFRFQQPKFYQKTLKPVLNWFQWVKNVHFEAKIVYFELFRAHENPGLTDIRSIWSKGLRHTE